MSAMCPLVSITIVLIQYTIKKHLDGMNTDNVQIEPNTTNNSTMVEQISYNECCLFSDTTVQECGPTTRRKFYRLMDSKIFILIK